ncbi:hypothetical protein ACB092_01G198900 [Castanea dentata]
MKLTASCRPSTDSNINVDRIWAPIANLELLSCGIDNFHCDLMVGFTRKLLQEQLGHCWWQCTVSEDDCDL